MCGSFVSRERWDLGRKTCLACGESVAVSERLSWCVVPMHKSNYFLCTDKTDLQGINNKGGLVK